MTHRIPTANLPKLLTKLDKLAKRADRLNIDRPTYRITGTEQTTEIEDDGWAHVVDWTLIDITGPVVALDGWTLAAVIHRDNVSDGPNVVHVVDGALKPEWRTIGDTCDHCHRNNLRRKTLVAVRNEANEERIVGITCVADFLGGVDPQQVAEALAYLVGYGEVTDEDTYLGGAPTGERRLTLTALLAQTAAVIRVNGWRSATAANEYGGISTRDEVLRIIDRPTKDDITITDEDRDTARAAIEWARTLNPDQGDYIANCQAVACRETVERRAYGIACSIVATYQRHLLDEAAKAQAPVSQHVGQIGKRQVFTGTVKRTWWVDTLYGTVTWVTAVDDDGNVLSWKASGCAPEEGQRITGKATVKAHDDWKGTAQTVLTRWAWTAV